MASRDPQKIFEYRMKRKMQCAAYNYELHSTYSYLQVYCPKNMCGIYLSKRFCKSQKFKRIFIPDRMAGGLD